MNKDYFDDIKSQHNVIDSFLESSCFPRNEGKRTYKTIFIAGNGDSYTAALVMQYIFQHKGNLPVKAIHAGDAAHFLQYDSNDCLISLSISGNSTMLSQSMEKASAAGAHTIAISNNSNNGIASRGKEFFRIPIVSKNRNTPHASDYLSSLIILTLLLETISGYQIIDLHELKDYLQKNIMRYLHTLESLDIPISSSQRVIILGADINYPTALFGAAKFWETRGIDAQGINIDDFGHGLHLTLKHDDLVILLPSAFFSQKRIASIIQGLTTSNINILQLTAGNDSCITQNSMVLDELANTYMYPYIHQIPLQWISYLFSKAKQLDVTTGLGNLESINYNVLNPYLR